MQGDTWEPEYEIDRWMQAIAAQRDIGVITSGTRGYLYRRGRLLVENDVLTGKRTGSELALRALRDARADRIGGKESEAASELGLAVLRVNEQAGTPSLVRDLRRAVVASASLEHVLVGNPRRYFGCDPAEPADEPAIPGKGSVGEGLTVAVLDTGISSRKRWAQVDARPEDEEVLDEDTDALLDAPAGHGTFVTGRILEYAPGAKIIARRVLKTPAGLGSELDIATALLELPDVDVINCSFGGPVQNDDSPLTVERAIARLSPKTVIVAAAGNTGDPRPQWPAASKRVIGVGWAKGRGDDWTRHEDASWGPWVDACAPGTDVLGAFVTFDESAGTPPAGQPKRDFRGGALWSGSSFAAPAVTAAIVALASKEGISAKEAAFRLVWAPDVPQVADLGSLLLPPSP